MLILVQKKKKQKYLSVCKEIDNLVDEIGINKEMSDDEKYQKIVYYILKNTNYDKDILVASKANNFDKAQEFVKEKDLYDGGYLKGALESNTQICGNIAALGEAIFKRCGFESCLLGNTSHIWNLVKYDGKTYCLDLTTMNTSSIVIDGKTVSYEEAIKEEKTNELFYYKEIPSINNMKEIDPLGGHDYKVFPDYMKDDKFSIRLTRKEIEVDSTVFITLLLLFDSIIILSHRKTISELLKEKKQR